MDDKPDSVKLALLSQSVDNLLKWQEAFVRDMGARFDRLDNLLDKIVLGRPSWSVAILLTLLSSAVVGLLVKQILG